MLKCPTTVEFENQHLVGILRNLSQHSPECLATFPGMFRNILWNVWWLSPECLTAFPGMFANIPWNITSPLLPAFPAFRSLFLYSWFYTFNVGLFCLINKDSDTFQGRCQNLKGQGPKPEKRAQFILNYILVFTFNFIYLIFYKSSFFCFQQQLIFK